ncbi:prepilin-type N-terminal cleavage/methylation domain-containing protein [candidate division WWE3 bacterium]|uniref:Prepilin-type N-terminal cleavage/methylation domain-containing protein n=1 Tax=candidate division WWE3 bacterium TaxID=2053526 RepID=A0A955LH47_UNCKA|nr:prepilin-type N-terminal cleavage/methylation domain-containing protein [candidate division WWE3 bacterium]
MYFSNKGVTIIELLITVAIASIILSLGIRYLGSINEREVLNTFSEELVTDLKAAQNRAASSIQDATSPGRKVVAVQVSINTDNYVISRLLDNGTTEQISRKAQKPMEFTTTQAQFTFTMPTAKLYNGTAGAPLGSDVVITVLHSGISKSRQIIVRRNGSIYIN